MRVAGRVNATSGELKCGYQGYQRSTTTSRTTTRRRTVAGGPHQGPPGGVATGRVSVASVGAELPRLLAEHHLTYRALASLVGVTHTHLVHLVHERERQATGELAARIAVVLALPHSYFPETREAVVLDAVRRDPAYRDQLYQALTRSNRS